MLVSLGASLILFLGWAVSGRAPILQAVIRRQLGAAWAPYVFRMVPAVVPIWIPLVWLIGAIGNLGGSALQWGIVAISDAFLVALLATYRAPRLAMPNWLRSELTAGTTAPARPDSWDWMIFWFLAVSSLLITVGVPLLVFVYHEGT